MNRTKEIGIRKGLGAGLGNIIIQLNKEYVSLSLIASALAGPVSHYAMTNWWLKNFHFHVTAGWELFVLSIACALVIAISSVSYHTVRSALLNPSRILKSD